METPAETKLANPSDPLTTDDGKVVEQTTLPSMLGSTQEILSNNEIQRRRSATLRRMDDIPAPEKQRHAISLVCMYTMLGISAEEISECTNLTVQQIENIRMLEAYDYIYRAATETILQHDGDDIRAVLAGHARRSIDEIAMLRDNSDFDAVRLSASKDLLDRAGHRPADIVEHRHTLEGELRINVVKEQELGDTEVDIFTEDPK